MTRKRFVKVLMALGCEPLLAQTLARRVNRAGRPYAEAFWPIIFDFARRGVVMFGPVVIPDLYFRLRNIGKLPGLEVPHE